MMTPTGRNNATASPASTVVPAAQAIWVIRACIVGSTNAVANR
jgi:hypothetical protein